MSEGERPLRSANITRLRIIYRDCKSEVRILEELRDELKKRRTGSARELLATVQRQLERIAAAPHDDMNEGEPIANDAQVSNEAKDNTKGPAGRVLSTRETAAQKRIGNLRMRLLDLSNASRLLNYKFSNRSRRQVRLIDQLPNELIDKLKEGKRLVFKSLPEPGDEPEDERSDSRW